MLVRDLLLLEAVYTTAPPQVSQEGMVLVGNGLLMGSILVNGVTSYCLYNYFRFIL